MFVVGVLLAILVGFGLGANDVANTFAPSVAARALTMKQALLVAAIFEFTGAVLMGAGVVETIRSGITNIAYFYDSPDVLAYGMLCAMASTAIWILVATWWELPVSSTQSIVASIAGMAIVAEGWNAVVWSAEKDQFPYLKGMSAIALSWLFAPIMAGLATLILFLLIRTLVLRAPNAYQRSIFLLPLFTFLTFFIVTWFIIARGGIQYGWEKTPDSKKAWISAIVASGTTLISIFVGIPLLKRKVQRDMEAQEQRAASAPPTPGKEASDIGKTSSGSEQSDEEAGSQQAAEGGQPPAHATPKVLETMRRSRMWRSMTAAVNHDIHAVVETDERVAQIHANSEQFDSKAETSFKYLQVCTACANSFAHGSNEVANSVGALAAIYQIWRDSEVSDKPDVPTWLLAIGGSAIVFGLAMFGHKVMQSMGVKMTRLTNSRGFCVELCVAAVIIVASRYGLPMSSTPATVGAIAGVGLLEGRAGFNFRLFLKFCAGWVFTIFATVGMSCAFMAQGLYSPNKSCAAQRADVGAYLNTTANAIATVLSGVGTGLGNATLVEQAQNITTLTAGQQVPLLSLWGPMDTQALALGYLANDTVPLLLQ
jgi:sodium-dependent phosphate transporter